jgi:uncharacterized membrane protein
LYNAITWLIRIAGIVSAGFIIARLAGYPVNDGNVLTAVVGILLWLSTEWDLRRKKRR